MAPPSAPSPPQSPRSTAASICPGIPLLEKNPYPVEVVEQLARAIQDAINNRQDAAPTSLPATAESELETVVDNVTDLKNSQADTEHTLGDITNSKKKLKRRRGDDDSEKDLLEGPGSTEANNHATSAKSNEKQKWKRLRKDVEEVNDQSLSNDNTNDRINRTREDQEQHGGKEHHVEEPSSYSQGKSTAISRDDAPVDHQDSVSDEQHHEALDAELQSDEDDSEADNEGDLEENDSEVVYDWDDEEGILYQKFRESLAHPIPGVDY